jgi:hypothetical protein
VLGLEKKEGMEFAALCNLRGSPISMQDKSHGKGSQDKEIRFQWI